ncbi:hypothetical protein H257_01849 [Aphanomyces astaci]|uniref:Uncharacterized protein n=1 Tax=Aphanomyces astaci TaxID=112090 RepID=W4H586_APHAT|nr:hypothetical protein H257_01849 [Aphanomyces astaci]ETV86766.1 hypothetical protein H257_01849 [Aphanomyces astaci]|eukprot:XP_009823565.1 hypothetical protein H257_01849 [Aphanomyces astaci]
MKSNIFRNLLSNPKSQIIMSIESELSVQLVSTPSSSASYDARQRCSRFELNLANSISCERRRLGTGCSILGCTQLSSKAVLPFASYRQTAPQHCEKSRREAYHLSRQE